MKKNLVQRTLIERRILEKVKHPNIVRMDYAFQTDKTLFYALEYCPGGDLFFYI